MPGDPYVLSPDPMTIRGALDLLFWASAPIHARYDGQHDWSSGVLLGRISAPSDQSDLQTEGTLALHRLSNAIFDRHRTRVTGLTWHERSIDGHPGMLVSAQVHYRVERLPSRYDTVTALLVRLDDGSVIMAASSVPNDTDSDDRPPGRRGARNAHHSLAAHLPAGPILDGSGLDYSIAMLAGSEPLC